MAINPLTEDEKELFSVIIGGDFDNLALARSALDGEECSILIAVNGDEETGEAVVTPLAILLVPGSEFADAIFDRLADPSAD